MKSAVSTGVGYRRGRWTTDAAYAFNFPSTARVGFRYKDYRAEGEARPKLMTVDASEFIRRFLVHVLPDGFHRIRHYGFLANGVRVAAIARARALLSAPAPEQTLSDEAPADAEPQTRAAPCPCCGGRMILVERFERGAPPRRSPQVFRIDSS